jgi:hypothetical protein
MSQAGFTPIQLYFSTTAAAVPVNTNLANGELAINITDEKLYFKNAAGVVKLLASNATSAPVLSFSAGTTGLTPNTATTGAVTLAGTLATTNGGTGLTSFTTNGVVHATSSSALTTSNALALIGTSLSVNGTNANISIDGGGVGGIGNVLGVVGTSYGYVGTNTLNTPLVFQINSAEQMRLTTTGLGIGTSSPAAKLDVQAATATLKVASTTGTNAAYLYAQNTGGDFYFGRDNSTGATFGTNSAYSAVLWSAGAYPMAFFTNNTERMRIDSAGNVGIGTSSPTTTLHLAKAGATYMRANNTTSTIDLYVGSQTNDATVAVISNHPLSFATNSAERMRISASGDVGIGTSSPLQKLDVNGDMRVANAVRYYVGSTEYGVSFANAGAVGTEAYQGTYIYWGTGSGASATERARIDTSGNLLVGTTSGTQRLVVSKNDSGAYVGYFENTTGSNANGVLISTPNRAGSNGLYGLTVANSGGNAFAIYTDGTYGTISDINRKKNVETARNGYLTDLCALRVVKYNWKEQEDSEPKNIGFIAQEVEQVFPSMVQTDSNGQKMLTQPILIPMLVKAIQELKAEFDAYKASHP